MKILSDGQDSWKLVLESRIEQRHAWSINRRYKVERSESQIGCTYIYGGFQSKAKAERLKARIERRIAGEEKLKQERLRKLHKPERGVNTQDLV